MCTCSLWKLLFFKPLNSPITIILLIRFQKKSSEPLCPLTPQNAISPPKTSLYFCFVPCHSAGHKETPEHQLRETPYNTFILSPKEVIKKKKITKPNQTKLHSPCSNYQNSRPSKYSNLPRAFLTSLAPVLWYAWHMWTWSWKASCCRLPIMKNKTLQLSPSRPLETSSLALAGCTITPWLL